MFKTTLKMGAIVFSLIGQSMAHASIIDTANMSFIDTETGYEWMDFGVNNGYSYDQVAQDLRTTWQGWSLATETQVVELWSNAFDINDQFPNAEYPYYSSTNGAEGSALDPSFSAMGYNSSRAEGTHSAGFFYSDASNLTAAWVSNNYAVGSTDYVEVDLLTDYWMMLTDPNPSYSTFLVKTVATVPEPAPLTLLALGLAGLWIIRKKKSTV